MANVRQVHSDPARSQSGGTGPDDGADLAAARRGEAPDAPPGVSPLVTPVATRVVLGPAPGADDRPSGTLWGYPGSSAPARSGRGPLRWAPCRSARAGS